MILIVGMAAFGQNQRIYQTIAGESKNDEIQAMLPTAEKGWLLAGNTETDSNTTYGFLMEVDSIGQLQQSIYFGGNKSTHFYDLKRTHDKGYLIVGGTNSFGAGAQDALVIKLDKHRKVQWSTTIGGGSLEILFGVIETPDSQIVAAGVTYKDLSNFRLHGGPELYLIGLDQAGTLKWTRVFHSIYNTYTRDIILTPDTHLAVVGGEGLFQDYDVFLSKHKLDGTIKWRKIFGKERVSMARGLVATDQNDYVIMGRSNATPNLTRGFVLLKTNSKGDLQWQTGFVGEKTEYIHDIERLVTGELMVTGATSSFGPGSYSAFLYQYTRGGDPLGGVFYGKGGREEGITLKRASHGIGIGGLSNSFGAQQQDAYLLQTTPAARTPCYDSTFEFEQFNPNFQVADSLFDTVYTNAVDSVTSPTLITDTVLPTQNMICTDTVGQGLLKADFTDSISQRTVYFTNTSVNATDWTWHFGDNSTSSTLHPVHTYDSNKTYYVYLVARNQISKDIAYDTLTLCGPPQAHFTYDEVSPDSFQFHNAAGYDTAWHWHFGDGTTGYQRDPVHRYDSSGIYTPCLYTFNACGQDTFCDTVNVVSGLKKLESSPPQPIISPNPANKKLELSYAVPRSLERLYLYDMTGQLVVAREFKGTSSDQYRIELPELGRGIYFLKLQTAQDQQVLRLLVDQE
jgi:PKD repeat protein